MDILKEISPPESIDSLESLLWRYAVPKSKVHELEAQRAEKDDSLSSSEKKDVDSMDEEQEDSLSSSEKKDGDDSDLMLRDDVRDFVLGRLYDVIVTVGDKTVKVIGACVLQDLRRQKEKKYVVQLIYLTIYLHHL